MDHFPNLSLHQGQAHRSFGRGDSGTGPKLRCCSRPKPNSSLRLRPTPPRRSPLGRCRRLTAAQHACALRMACAVRRNCSKKMPAMRRRRRRPQTARMRAPRGALVNIARHLHDEPPFITPAIVTGPDPSPSAPKAAAPSASPARIEGLLEERLPATLGTLARIGKFRKNGDALPFGRARRDFWRDYTLLQAPAPWRMEDGG